jgi:hypothetical protein
MKPKRTLSEIEKLDPFEIPLERYRSLSNDEDWLLTQRLFALHGPWIREQLKATGAGLIIVCDRKVVYTSKDEDDLAADRVAEELERKLKKPCYIITREPLIEEQARWSDLGGGDYYPTLELYFGAEDWDDRRVFREGRQITCDFDTGNPQYTVLDEAICRALTGIMPRSRGGQHLGGVYRYRPRLMKVGVADRKEQRCLTKVVRGVEDWDDPIRNPYKLANPGREGFVGRDLMLQLSVRITLDPKQRRSEWQLL